MEPHHVVPPTMPKWHRCRVTDPTRTVLGATTEAAVAAGTESAPNPITSTQHAKIPRSIRMGQIMPPQCDVWHTGPSLVHGLVAIATKSTTGFGYPQARRPRHRNRTPSARVRWVRTSTAAVHAGLTNAATDSPDAVLSMGELTRLGTSRGQVRAALDAGRWQRVGRAIVLHNGELNREQQWRAALISCGPGAVLTGLAAAQVHGLNGWATEHIDVLVAVGSLAPPVPGLSIRLHRTRRQSAPEIIAARRLHRVAPAVVLASDLMLNPRSACGLLAAAAQQRLTTALELGRAVEAARRTRHRPLLRAIIADIGMGADALSEIDFAHLCRKYQLPLPERQAVRVERDGRRRYLDAFWRRADRQAIAVEVDGALHLEQRQWWSDQLRQKEIVLSGVLVLRFPSALIRTEPALVAAQLRRALGLV